MTGNPYLDALDGLRSYSGQLAEPIAAASTPAASGLLALVNDTGPGFEEQRKAKLPALFAHFDIDAVEPDAWQRLALALAHRHVPGMQRAVDSVGFGLLQNPYLHPPMLKRGRGRPRKPKAVDPSMSRFGLLGWIEVKRRPGRPTEWTEEAKRALVHRVDELKVMLKQEGYRPTAIAACELLLRIAKPESRGWRRERVLRAARAAATDYSRWQKELRESIGN